MLDKCSTCARRSTCERVFARLDRAVQSTPPLAIVCACDVLNEAEIEPSETGAKAIAIAGSCLVVSAENIPPAVHEAEPEASVLADRILACARSADLSRLFALGARTIPQARIGLGVALIAIGRAMGTSMHVRPDDVPMVLSPGSGLTN